MVPFHIRTNRKSSCHATCSIYYIKRGSQWDYNRQPSNGLKFNLNRQECKLTLTIKKFQGISNLAFLSVLSISADLHGLLASEESLTETRKPVPMCSETDLILLDISRLSLSK